MARPNEFVNDTQQNNLRNGNVPHLFKKLLRNDVEEIIAEDQSGITLSCFCGCFYYTTNNRAENKNVRKIHNFMELKKTFETTLRKIGHAN